MISGISIAHIEAIRTRYHYISCVSSVTVIEKVVGKKKHLQDRNIEIEDTGVDIYINEYW